MRRVMSSAIVVAVALSGGAALAQSDYDVASISQQRAMLVQCQKDLGYGAAGLTIGTDFGSGAKRSVQRLRVVPNAQISPAAASEINQCAESSVIGTSYGQPAPKVRRKVPMVTVDLVGCTPDAPALYRGTLYCNRNKY
ncbi:hypothetical protein [Puniceibacterium sp. IMCC21224]|uniref:hypothetical protein n=1 Tax=Puniceibacterium sp. IMCC21224 TaxID=1618204 RepID=UPI00064D91C2|nr:hypothetical protein [Puniceibacterium sp. IMCC21224]KMK66359.1 hypothetical protein IMCC21224_111209 [Puniceibacterium sp. IMCC21224]